jgi:hypothetical protein
MRAISMEDGGFRLEAISESELAALRHVPSDADTTGTPEARGRLFPPGFAGSEETADAGDNADWEEFVHPDLRALFEDDVVQVGRDLNAASPVAGRHQIVVSAENVERWFRAFNQARIVMHTRYSFPDESELGEEETMARITSLLQSGEFAAFLRARLYAEIQEWIVVNCLKY